ncbi:hypothetical protein DMENIID0001_065220 [Sergentomyia squamirostris]
MVIAFFPQRATLAEKEVSTLKEQLSSGSPNKAITQNGAITSECPQSSSPALSESGATNLSSKLNVKSELELTGELKMEPSGQAANSNRTSPGPCDKADSHKSTTPSVTQTTLPASTDSNHSTTSGSGRTLADDLAAKDKEVSHTEFYGSFERSTVKSPHTIGGPHDVNAEQTREASLIKLHTNFSNNQFNTYL